MPHRSRSRGLVQHPAVAWCLWVSVRAIQRPTRWFSRRFTTAGAMVVAGLLVTGGTANPTQTLGLPAFLVLGTLLLVAMAWAPFFRAPLLIRRTLPRLAPCGQPLTYAVTIRNPTRRWQRGLVYGEDLREASLDLAAVRAWLRYGDLRPIKCSPVEVPPIPPRGSVIITVSLTTFRRGRLRLPAALLSRSDPLGLFRGFQTVGAAAEVMVLPPRHALPPVALPGIGSHQPGGEAESAGYGTGEEFVALRDYRRGDPRKHIHWRSSARRGALVVREFHESEQVRQALVLDPGLEGAEGAFEDAVAVAASFACSLPAQQALLDLLVVGGRCLHLGHDATPGPMLEALADVQPRPQDLDGLVDLALGQAHRMRGCLLVFLALDAPRRAVIRSLRAVGVPVVVLLIAEAAPALAPEDRPERLVVVPPGRLPIGLSALGGVP